ncbi:MAG: carbamoyltransferase C-terminal domain-containing protein, partial [Myxococcota bacterium]|nr:carbamoyltransferase C-terminal domain-containing protein [Myxococcota bacterium]
ALEEEKLVRVRHYGWKPRVGPGFRNLGVDPTLTVEQVLCRRSVRVLLAENGLTLDDVDLFAVNGLLSRYRRALPVLDETSSIPVLQSGRLVCIPHHLCHAASAYRLSGLEAAWVLTVDGRGDRETAALFRGEGDQLTPVKTLLSLTDRSVGGVYETVTRLLGFGGHGQGSVMALAAFGNVSRDLEPYLSAGSWSDVSVHEGGLQDRFASLSRTPEMPIQQAHKNLAASLQAALEQTLTTLVETGIEGGVDALCLAGGVALNCRMNNLMRTTFRPDVVWVQPGANDAGTAVGAAAEAWAQSVGGNLEEMVFPGVGPSFSPEQIEGALRRAGVSYTRVDDIAEVSAGYLADGEVVCWFQGGLEFGPRALGARSILGDPRRVDMQNKVNSIKMREKWRPFGPSILAGHEDDWFVDAFDSRFMLFTLEVKAEKRDQVPAVVHVDGTSRPQVVHAEHQPVYHRMLSSFYGRTGVPLVLNTSFNRRGEPIVCTPEDALAAFPELGADVLAIGPFVVRRGERTSVSRETASISDAELADLPGGRRLSLRMTTRCDLECVHCTLRDHSSHGEARRADLEKALVDGRQAGCDELVVMRGEATLRPDLPSLLRRARMVGYRFIQLQTHGCRLALPGTLESLDGLVDAYELMLLGYEPGMHDRLVRRSGAFAEVIKAAQVIQRTRAQVWVTIPVLHRNSTHLPRMVALAAKLGLPRVQFAFPRPVELVDGVPSEELLRLSDAARAVNRAAVYAQRIGITISTEGFPLCLLDAPLHGTPDATEDFSRHRIDDLGLVHDDFDGVREKMRPVALPCRDCSLRDSCPKTWGLYLEIFGTGELKRVG